MTAPSPVLEVTDETFSEAVIDESNNRPVVVDFWAEWCGPCRVLSPIIEAVAAEFGDDVLLAKLDTDRNPQTSATYGIQAIPSVKAFVDGEVANEFAGALPEEHVRAFFAQLVTTPSEMAAAEAEEMAASGDLAGAEARYNEMLEEDAENADALTGLAAILLERDDREGAEELLERAGSDRRAKALRHHMFLEEFAGKHDAPALEEEARLDPTDPRARYRWGVMLAAYGRYEEALDELLESVRLDRRFADDAARKAVLAVFDILGLESTLVREYQRRLTQLLF
ncbi:MAG: thioredoxin [Chloroflexi bacterium]|nr:thioredoxin [Chloroflexota bacterium]